MKKLLFTIGFTLPALFFCKTTKKDSKCDLPANYQKSKPDKKVRSFLKKVDATIEDLRKHIAVENDCNEKDVIFLRISEQKGNGM